MSSATGMDITGMMTSGQKRRFLPASSNESVGWLAETVADRFRQ